MTTSKLIDNGRNIADFLDNNVDKSARYVMRQLCDKLKMAHNDLLQGCGTCLFYGIKVDDRCKNCHQAHQYAEPSDWQWRGDEG